MTNNSNDGTQDQDVLRISFKKEDGGTRKEKDSDALDDPRYIKRAADLVREAMADNSSILQLGDGSILVTKTSIAVVLYKWDKNKSRFTRAKAGSRESTETSGATRQHHKSTTPEHATAE